MATATRLGGQGTPVLGPVSTRPVGSCDTSLILGYPSPSRRFDCHRLLGEPGGFRGAPLPHPALHVLVGLPAGEVSEAGGCGEVRNSVTK